ncbi:T9SS type A sorting domain-containing protein [Flavobacteriales bacterium]|nr:T9SS type A sorting domain-containing protein [Flavobacteriales bacterium]
MKKTLLIIFAILTSLGFAYAQTTATNFTTNDCDGISHTLFDELDDDKVIVISWVMPCTPCATYAGYAADAVQAFATSHPGRVKHYLADDYANSTCSYLSGWASNYNISTDAVFSDGQLDMSDYGTPGMPKVVVLGKNSHTIYYNKNDNTITQIDVEDAITLALTATVGIDEEATNLQLNAYPNPTTGFINIEYTSQSPVQFDVINMLGEKVLSQNTNNTKNATVDVSNLTKGIYFLRMIADSKTTNLKFILSN